MNSRLHTGVTVVLAMMVGALGMALYLQGGPGRTAVAQDSTNIAGIIGMIGAPANKDVPIALIDTRSQVLLVYQYNTATERMKLIQARSYRWDRQLTEFPSGGAKPSVKEVEEYIRRNPPN